MNKHVNINNAEINLGHLNSQVISYKYYVHSATDKRLTAIEIFYELGDQFEAQKEYIDFLQSSALFSTSTLREVIKEIRLAYILVNSRSLQQFTQILEETTSGQVNKIMSEYGVVDALKLLRTTPEKTLYSDEVITEMIISLDNIFLSHQSLVDEYATYNSLWIESNIKLQNRLESLKLQSLIITIILLLLIILVAVLLAYRITNVITVNLNEVNSSLSKMTNGDFSTSLHIAAGDEFGDLSRNFNQFIQQLWKKLDSMNVIMTDIGHAMNEDLNLTKIQTNILNNVTNHIISDAAAIFNFKNGELKITASKGHFPPFYPIDEDLSGDRPRASRYLLEHPVPMDSVLVQQCFETREPIIIKDCSKDNNFPQSNDPKSALYIGSLMMVPLINAGEIIGIFVVLRTTNKKSFSDLDFSNFSSFSDYAALTIDTLEKYNELIEKFEMQKEIGVAADIQQSLVPGKMPQVKGLTSSAFTVAAKGVSGDYYDFFRMNKYTIGATVCDVAGKGVPASLVMVMIRTILRLVSSPSRGAAETLTMLNRSISGKIDVDRYATMAYFKIDLEHMKLNYSNAAHHPIQIFRQKAQKFYAIDSPGLPIGIDRDATFTEKRVSLSPGDIIFMYTDGFPEARNKNGDEYSTNRMLREIRLHCNSNATQILDSIVGDMQKFTAGASQHDDQTILIIKIDEEN